MPLRLCRFQWILLGFQLSRWQMGLMGQHSSNLTLFGVLPGVHTKVWMERFRLSNSPVKQDGLLLEPEEAFNMLW